MIHSGGAVMTTLVLAGVMVALHDPPLDPSHQQLCFSQGLGVRIDDEVHGLSEALVTFQRRGIEHKGPPGRHRADSLASRDLHHRDIVPIHGDDRWAGMPVQVRRHAHSEETTVPS